MRSALEVDASDLPRLVAWALEHRLVGLLGSVGAHLGIDDGPIAEARLTSLRQAVTIEAFTAPALDALIGSGCRPIVFKGVANAHADYPDPAMRTFYDADVLVPRERFPTAIATLTANGWAHIPPPLGTRWESRFARAATFRHREGVELDLHAALAPGYFGVRLADTALREHVEPAEVAGVATQRFTADARLLATCYGLVLTRGGSLRLVRDVAQLLLVTNADPAAAAKIARDSDAVIATAIRRVADLIALPPEHLGWALSVMPTARQQHALQSAQDGARRGWRAEALSEMSAYGWNDRLRYTTALWRRARPRDR